MRHFDEDERSRMRDTQESAMQDVVRHLPYSSTQSASGHLTPDWPDGELLVCGIDMRPSAEAERQDMTVEYYGGRLRLPLGTVIDQRDRFRVVSRYGENADPETVYFFSGPAEIGVSGIVIPFEKVVPSV